MEQEEVKIERVESIGRTRNSCIEVLVEDDMFILDGEYYHVTSGEIRIFADGTIDKANGEIAEVDKTAMLPTMMRHKHIVDVDELK